jgi:2-succinyl-5-enolpyruvyl-6-hydroxy-3-cyclohexene-1-carboxylate synthase
MEPSEFERLMRTPRELELSQVAALFGVEHRRPQERAGLRRDLGAGSGLIEVRVDPAADRELRGRLGAAVAGALRVALEA